MSTDLDRNITLRGTRELAERAGVLFGTAQREFICAASDHETWSKPALDTELGGVRDWRPPPGLRVHKLFAAAALADQEHRRHLIEITGHGARVRICASAPAHETIIIDRRVAILAGPPRQGVRTYTVVRSPDVIDGVRSLFWATWDAATDLREYRTSAGSGGLGDRGGSGGLGGFGGLGGLGRPRLDEQSRQILRLLGDGLKDETAARRLGLSLRTYRRRVAELMALLGAETRFQAGHRARELGIDD